MKKLAILFLTLATAAPALADRVPAGGDPNEVICRSTPVVGSRLARQRRCVTRAQWAQDDQLEREAIRRGQQTQVNPQTMSLAERMRSQGRYNAIAGRTTRPTN